MVLGWAARRTGARRAVVLALAALIGITAFLLAGITGYGSRVGTVGLRDFLTTADATASSLQVQTRLAPDAEAQQLAADALLGGLFAGLHVISYRSVTLPPTPVTATSRSPGAPAGKPTIRMAAFDDLPAHAHLLAGTWPDPATAPRAGGRLPTAQPAALAADAAAALGLAVGDTLSVGNTDRITFDIAAVFAPNDPGDPYFAADAAAARGSIALAADRLAAGFIAVAPAVLAAKGTAALVNWTIVPDTTRLVPAEMTAMAEAVAKVPDAVVADRAVAPQGAVSAGGLAATLRTVTGSVAAAQAVNPVPSLLVAAISLLMLVQLARLLAAERRPETALIRSRGASAGRLTRFAVAEAALITVPAAAAGVGAATGILRLSQAQVPLTGWVQVAVAAVVAIAVISLPAAHQARLPADRQGIDDSGRIRAVTAASTVVLILIAAAIAVWRFRRSGSALLLARDGTTRIDPIAVLAPALVLIAAAVLAGVAFGLLAAIGESAAARLRGLGVPLGARQVARRGTVFGVVVILSALAVGAIGIAASYSPTQSVMQTRTDVLRNGAPLLVAMPSVDPLTPGPYRQPPAGMASGLPVVGATLAALRQPIRLGEQDAVLVAVSADRMGSVVPDAGSSFRPGRLADLLATRRAGWELPAGTTAVTMQISAGAAWHVPGLTTAHSDGPDTQEPGGWGPSGVAVSFEVAAWVQEPSGVLVPVAADGTVSVVAAPIAPPAPASAAITIPLPGLVPGSRLVALDLLTPVTADPMDVTMAVTNATAQTPAGGRPLDLSAGRWEAGPAPQPGNGLIPQLLAYPMAAATSGTGLSGSVPAGQFSVARLTAATPPAVPVAVNEALADALRLAPGADLTIGLDAARQFPARIVAVSPLLPGDAGTPTLLADLSALGDMLLRTTPDLPGSNELWAAPVDPAAAAAALRPLVPPTSIMTTADTRSAQALIRPAALTLWFGAAGSAALAAIGVASVIASLSRARRGELVVLRSVGVPARRQAQARRRELFVTAAVGWLFGLAVAAAAVFTTVTALARSAVVGPLGVSASLHVGWRLAALVAGVHGAAVIVIVAVHGIRLRRQVLRATPSELVL